MFLVIQHSELRVQKKYYPIMKVAVEKGNALSCDLALLIDRIRIREGKKQIYGSQIGYDEITKSYYILPLIKPSEVDKRREKVGLEPISDYISIYDLIWDVKSLK